MDNEPHESTHQAAFEADKQTPPSLDNEVLSSDVLRDDIDTELVLITRALESALRDPAVDPVTLRQLWTEYDQHFEASVEQATDVDERTKRQITAILRKAFIFDRVGLTLRYLEELDKAVVYVRNKAFDELEVILSAEIDVEVASLEQSPERLILQLRGKISDENHLYLWDLWLEEQDYEDLINHAYGMLLEDGEDPEEVLRVLGIIK